MQSRQVSHSPLQPFPYLDSGQVEFFGFEIKSRVGCDQHTDSCIGKLFIKSIKLKQFLPWGRHMSVVLIPFFHHAVQDSNPENHIRPFSIQVHSRIVCFSLICRSNTVQKLIKLYFQKIFLHNALFTHRFTYLIGYSRPLKLVPREINQKHGSNSTSYRCVRQISLIYFNSFSNSLLNKFYKSSLPLFL